MFYKLDVTRLPIIANLAFNCQHFSKPPHTSRPTLFLATVKVMSYMVMVVGAFIREARVLIEIVMHAARNRAAAWNVQVCLWRYLT